MTQYDPYAEIERRAREATTLDEYAQVLEELLDRYAVWNDGKLYNIKANLGDAGGNLRIVVYPHDHAPPHFHVVRGSINAKFTISDCTHIGGDIGGRELQLVQFWFERNRPLLVRRWNETRTTGDAHLRIAE